MYFVRIDLHQLNTRLMYSSHLHAVDVSKWLSDQGFFATTDGWCGSADSMNSLSCSEILYSERLEPAALRHIRRQHRDPYRRAVGMTLNRTTTGVATLSA